MFSLLGWYVQYTALYEPQNLTAVVDDVANRFDLLWNHTYKATNGLIVHGYDESKIAVWANPVTGASPSVWGRSMGWYLTGLLETLEVLPREFVLARHQLQSKFQRLAGRRLVLCFSTDQLQQSGWLLRAHPRKSGIRVTQPS